MAMTPEQITAELQRKKNAGILPTSQANNAQYNKLSPTQTPKTQPTQPYTPSFNEYGGKDNYAAGQNDRWQQANQNNDQDLMSRLMADSKRAGYTLNPYTVNANNNSNTSSNDLLSRLNEVMNKQTMKELPQFNYDPNTDPQYQAALNRAKSNSETASGNAMAELNKRGILNSTITGDRLGQIEQSEYGRVSDTILPQLMEQAYGRHRDTVGDQKESGRNEIEDLKSLLGITNSLDQQKLDNSYRDNAFNWQKTTDTANLTGSLNGQKTLAGQAQDYSQKADQRNFDFQKAQQEWDNAFSKDQFNFQKAQTAWENAFKDKSFTQSVKDAAASRGLQWASLNQNQQQFLAREAWDKKIYEDQQSWKQKEWDWMQDPKNPSNSKNKVDFTSEYQGLKAGLSGGAITADVAILEIQKMVKAGDITAAEAQQLMNLATPYKANQLNSIGGKQNNSSITNPLNVDLNSLTVPGGGYLRNLLGL